jgi:glycosyltransferase involved in cell wall biosynthesis
VTEKTESPANHKSQISNRRSLLTAIVPTFNEESNISDCLASLSFADELLVVDSFSTDRTVELARGFPKVRVLQHTYEGNGPQCNWAMDQAAHPWVLIVDADERVTPELAREIERLLESEPEADLYRLRRRNLFLGRAMRGSGWGRDRLARLVRRGAARYPERKVHADIAGEGAPLLSAPLLHHTFRSFDHYLEKLDRYSRWGAEDLFRAGRRSSFVQIALRPAWRFWRSYFFEVGFLDGVHGVVLCGLQAYGVFLKWARLWELQKTSSQPSALSSQPGPDDGNADS